MLVYRHKCKSDEVIPQSELKHGLIVWVGDRPNREERIYSGGTLLTMEQYFKHKSERAARNRATFGDRHRRLRKEWNPFFVGGA